jgi:beta-glucosidase
MVGDEIRAPLTADSTLGEWLSDPKGAEVLANAFASVMADGGGDGLLSDPQIMLYLGSLPLRRLGSLPGSPIDAAAIEALVTAAN